MSCHLHRLALFGVTLLLIGWLATPAIAQEPSVSLSIDNIEQTEGGFLVTGTVGCSGPESGNGASHSYSVRVIAEIMEGDDAQYPKLPESLIIRHPEGAETSFKSGSGLYGTMTHDEYYGVNITTVQLGGLNGIGETEFSGKIPMEHAEKPMRIRAALDYQYNHVNAAWPSIRYYHAEGRSGVVPEYIEGYVPGDTDGDGVADPQPGDTKGGNAQTPDPTWSDENDVPPFSLPDDIGLTEQTDAESDGRLGSANTIGGNEADSEGIEADPPRQSDNEKIDEIIANIKSQLANPKLTDKQKQELLKVLNAAIIAQGTMNSNQVWEDYLVDSSLTVSDTMLTYNPVTGLYYTGTKVFTGIVGGQWVTDWQGVALNAATMIPTVHIPGLPPIPVGTIIQTGSDYYKVGHAFATQIDWNDGPDVVDGSGMYSHWGTYGNMGPKGTPGSPEPIHGVDR